MDANVILPKAHDKQREILTSEARFRVVACGRRFGKTTLGERAILKRAGELNHACWWLSPTYDMADHVWRDLKTAVRDLPDMQISESNLRMDFPNGGWIAIHSTHNPDHLRGAGLDFVVLDESAFMPPEIWPEIVRPMLVERKGHALFLSTPWGRNWFWQLYLLGQSADQTGILTPLLAKRGGAGGGDFSPAPEIVKSANVDILLPSPLCEASLRDGRGYVPAVRACEESREAGGEGFPEWHSWQLPSAANTLLDPAELESIRLQTPEHIWQQEYLAEFTDSAGQVFRGIRESAVAPLNAEPNSDTRYVAGLDWGRDSDYTAIVVMDASTNAVVAVDRFNQVSWELQRGRLKAICDRWQPVVIYAESNSIGSPNIEALQNEGLPVRPFLTTATSKAPLIDALSLSIERRELALIPDDILLSELAAYSLERLPAGSYRYAAPPGLHDDCVIALALAWYAARHSSLPISFS